MDIDGSSFNPNESSTAIAFFLNDNNLDESTRNDFLKFLNNNQKRIKEETAKNLGKNLAPTEHGDQSEDVVQQKLIERAENSYVSATRIFTDKNKSYLSTNKCKIHDEICIAPDAKKVTDSLNRISVLTETDEFQQWIDEISGCLQTVDMNRIINQAILLKSRRLNEMKIEICKQAEGIVGYTIINTVSKSIQLFISSNNKKYKVSNSVTYIALIFEKLGVDTHSHDIYNSIHDIVVDSNNLDKLMADICKIMNSIEICNIDLDQAYCCQEILDNNVIPSMIYHLWKRLDDNKKTFSNLVELINDEACAGRSRLPSKKVNIVKDNEKSSSKPSNKPSNKLDIDIQEVSTCEKCGGKHKTKNCKGGKEVKAKKQVTMTSLTIEMRRITQSNRIRSEQKEKN